MTTLRRRTTAIDQDAYVTNALTGSERILKKSSIDRLNKVLPRFGFTLTPPSPTNANWTVTSDRIILNKAAVRTKWDTRRRLKDYRRRVQETQTVYDQAKKQATGTEGGRIAIANDETLSNFYASVSTWPEIMEVANLQATMDLIDPVVKVDAGAFNFVAGARFWPVMVEEPIEVNMFGRRIATGYKWAVTPPMAFLLGDDVYSKSFGHPHVYEGTGKLCKGTAVFEYGNPFQMFDMLRQWYLGHTMNDYADRYWAEHAKQWWSANANTFFEKFGDGARVLLAPSPRREASEVVPLPRAIIDKMLATTNGKVTETDTDTAIKWSVIPAEQRNVKTCANCAAVYADLSAKNGRYTHHVCSHCATTHGFQLTHEPAPIDISRVRLNAYLGSARQNCSVPVCGDFMCEDPEHRSTNLYYRAHYSIEHGDKKVFVCESHYTFLTDQINRIRARGVDDRQVTLGEDAVPMRQTPYEASFADLIREMQVRIGETVAN